LDAFLLMLLDSWIAAPGIKDKGNDLFLPGARIFVVYAVEHVKTVASFDGCLEKAISASLVSSTQNLTPGPLVAFCSEMEEAHEGTLF
jgi:hypothetical protein